MTALQLMARRAAGAYASAVRAAALQAARRERCTALRTMLPATTAALRERRPDLWPLDPCSGASRTLQRDLGAAGATCDAHGLWQLPHTARHCRR